MKRRIQSKEVLQTMQIILDEFEPFQSKLALWSVIYVKIGETCFPGNQWQDATSSVLQMWIDEMIRLLYGGVDSIDLPFMDGDYCIRLVRQDTKQAIVSFIAPCEQIVLTEVVDLIYFARQLLSAASKIQNFYSAFRSSKQLQQLGVKTDILRLNLKKDI